MAKIPPRPKRRGAIDPSARTSVGVMLTPEQIAASDTEHGHQAAIFHWVAIEGRNHDRRMDSLFAIPNGGDRRPSVGAALKAEGVRSGVPDMCLPVIVRRGAGDSVGVFPGLYIELKRPGLEGRLLGGRSDHQLVWHKRLRANGYAVVTAYGWQAACWAIVLYLAGVLEMPDDDCFMATTAESPPRFEKKETLN